MEVFKKTTFWFFIVAISYCIAMLIYITIKFVFNESAEKISAFGSVLSAVGSFFTALIALYIFNGWKVTEDHKTKNTHINNAVTSFLSLQTLLRSSLNQSIEVQMICFSATLSHNQRMEILIKISSLSIDILHSLRYIKIHIQLFCTITNDLVLCGKLEQIIDNLESISLDKIDILKNTIPTGSPQDIMNAFNDYNTFMNGPFIIQLHLKIIIEITKESKALN